MPIVIRMIDVIAQSPFQALMMEKSAFNQDSNKYIFPSKTFTSFPMATSVPTPAGV